ncbi:MAG: hypothetical protein WBD20_25365 [Pirellulaceae bacterium]
MDTNLPPFASEWIKQWKEAAPRLQAIRDDELRLMGNGQKSVSVRQPLLYHRNPQSHGMVKMQAWFARRQIMDLTAQSKREILRGA